MAIRAHENESESTKEAFSCGVAAIAEAALAQLDGFRSEVRKIARENTRQTAKLARKELQLVDLSCLAFLRIFTFASNRLSRNESVVWHRIIPGRHPLGASHLFSMLIVNAFNSLLAARDLAAEGLYGQARGAFRQFVEVVEAAIVMLGDEGFLLTLTSGIRNEDLWPRLRPGVVRKRLAAIEERLFGADLSVSARVYRSDLYSWLSEASHVSPIGILCGAQHWPDGAEGPGRATLGGVVSTSTIGTLATMANYLWQTIGVLSRLLVGEHRWVDLAESNADLEAIGLMYAIVERGPALMASMEESRERR